MSRPKMQVPYLSLGWALGCRRRGKRKEREAGGWSKADEVHTDEISWRESMRADLCTTVAR